MELSVGSLLAQSEAAAIVIDCLPGMGAELVANRTAPLVRLLRANGHATTPIVLAEGTPAPGDWLASSLSGDWADARNDALLAAYHSLTAAGDTGLHYVRAADLFRYRPDPTANPTVCGVHPGDLGQYEMAEFYAHFLPTLLPNGDAGQ
jgi:hypothetical protein